MSANSVCETIAGNSEKGILVDNQSGELKRNHKQLVMGSGGSGGGEIDSVGGGADFRGRRYKNEII